MLLQSRARGALAWRPRDGGKRCVVGRTRRGLGRTVRASEVDEVEPSEVNPNVLFKQQYKFLDVREERAYEEEHLTKPAQCSKNLPLPEDVELLPQAAEAERLSKGTAWLVADEDGTRAVEAARALKDAGWETAAVVGGYRGWREVWTTSGRRVPPKGRWVATGKEALKSGLNVGGAALSYEERLNVEDLSKKEYKEFE
ncbi:hypothetical protein HOP50_19g84650 [Chloropicon primus]|uniref:Rhodanese domain-containing protein n=1 Tax=Chloropicon primus TaxID=1764295 RepID=A0A5B8N0X7_9CHLO|nr:hypothetical protein A3770_19p84340 [Chloropicon primus]UPR05117.1 hypothetical protein HOP50_19g84650 [Chloropicon primus]|mmetsp:Transcript_6704/g.19627  ORF Transcript_6704/g.19627 Transcript_6704/m.19627 type:complete len:199 (+) Transcript_6704:152-748(+)|eukprot:QDZ25916.1 hypothetical protein A3770_19p84340 [Chloropicon primus]